MRHEPRCRIHFWCILDFGGNFLLLNSYYPVPALHHGGRKCMASVAWWGPPSLPLTPRHTSLTWSRDTSRRKFQAGWEERPSAGSSPPRAPYAAPWPSRRVAAAWAAACGGGRRRERRSGLHIASARAGRRHSLPLIAVQEARLAPWKSRGLLHDPSTFRPRAPPSPAPPGPQGLTPGKSLPHMRTH